MKSNRQRSVAFVALAVIALFAVGALAASSDNDSDSDTRADHGRELDVLRDQVSCRTLWKEGNRNDGIYQISLRNYQGPAYCDMQNGGYTLCARVSAGPQDNINAARSNVGNVAQGSMSINCKTLMTEGAVLAVSMQNSVIPKDQDSRCTFTDNNFHSPSRQCAQGPGVSAVWRTTRANGGCYSAGNIFRFSLYRTDRGSNTLCMMNSHWISINGCHCHNAFGSWKGQASTDTVYMWVKPKFARTRPPPTPNVVAPLRARHHVRRRATIRHHGRISLKGAQRHKSMIKPDDPRYALDPLHSGYRRRQKKHISNQWIKVEGRWYKDSFMKEVFINGRWVARRRATRQFVNEEYRTSPYMYYDAAKKRWRAHRNPGARTWWRGKNGWWHLGRSPTNRRIMYYNGKWLPRKKIFARHPRWYRRNNKWRYTRRRMPYFFNKGNWFRARFSTHVYRNFRWQNVLNNPWWIPETNGRGRWVRLVVPSSARPPWTRGPDGLWYDSPQRQRMFWHRRWVPTAKFHNIAMSEIQARKMRRLARFSPAERARITHAENARRGAIPKSLKAEIKNQLVQKFAQFTNWFVHHYLQGKPGANFTTIATPTGTAVYVPGSTGTPAAASATTGTDPFSLQRERSSWQKQRDAARREAAAVYANSRYPAAILPTERAPGQNPVLTQQPRWDHSFSLGSSQTALAVGDGNESDSDEEEHEKDSENDDDDDNNSNNEAAGSNAEHQLDGDGDDGENAPPPNLPVVSSGDPTLAGTNKNREPVAGDPTLAPV